MIIHDYMPSTYAYEMEGEFSRTKDFDGRVDVIPVSDPNAATMSQRIMQYQSALQLAQQAPQLYDMGKLHRQMLEVLGISDAKEIRREHIIEGLPSRWCESCSLNNELHER